MNNRKIDGSFIGLYHWSEQEGKRWNPELKQFQAEDWRTLVKAAHAIGIHILVIQEVFRNQKYHGNHLIPWKGYQGKAFYPSWLYPGRMNLPDLDPINTILTEADSLQMSVIIGIGLYAWFDFTPDSLVWHQKVMNELWQRYGSHKSLAGWYISEEVCGIITPVVHHNLLGFIQRTSVNRYRKQLVDFISRLRKHADQFNPNLPLMLSPNCHFMAEAEKTWQHVLPYLGILCPFGFNRMPKGDRSAIDVAHHLAELCQDAGSHLWLDMEIFLFGPHNDLYPRPIGEIIEELRIYPEFEKIIAYQLPGLLNPPHARIIPGGPDTVTLYQAYQQYYESLLKKE